MKTSLFLSKVICLTVIVPFQVIFNQSICITILLHYFNGPSMHSSTHFLVYIGTHRYCVVKLCFFSSSLYISQCDHQYVDYNCVQILTDRMNDVNQ